MIQSWRNAASRKVWKGETPSQFRGLDFAGTLDLLSALNVASTRWRICFVFSKGDAHNVEIVDYHQGLEQCHSQHIQAAS